MYTCKLALYKSTAPYIQVYTGFLVQTWIQRPLAVILGTTSRKLKDGRRQVT